MIQPIKQFRVTRLTISGFKGYADQKTFQFGGMNVISGHMGVGKSSIADAIAFAITGVGFYAGAKIDYLYHQDTRDLLVELEFEDESGKLRTLARHRKDDKMDITLDGVRIGQGDLTTMFGERDLFLSMFNQIYWITGRVMGSVLGGLITFSTEGIDFALTALFVTIFVDQWLSTKDHRAALTGVIASVVCLLIFGADNFLITAMLCITAALTVMRSKLSRESIIEDEGGDD